MNNIIKVKIGQHWWSVRFVPLRIIGENVDGYTWTNKRCIDILEDLDEEATKLVFTHEIVHALLDTQGRCYQKQFDLEDMCEFIAWNIDEIVAIRDRVLKERYK